MILHQEKLQKKRELEYLLLMNKKTLRPREVCLGWNENNEIIVTKNSSFKIFIENHESRLASFFRDASVFGCGAIKLVQYMSYSKLPGNNFTYLKLISVCCSIELSFTILSA